MGVSSINTLPPSATFTFGRSPSITFTRPANTTAYTAGDVIGIADAGTAANAGSAIHELTGCGMQGGEVYVTDVTVTAVLAAIPSGMSSFRVEVYNASPTAILDNAAYSLLAADKAKHVLTVDSIVPVAKGAILRGRVSGVNEKVKLASGSSSLFVQLVTVGGFTPTSAESYTITLGTVVV